MTKSRRALTLVCIVLAGANLMLVGWLMTSGSGPVFSHIPPPLAVSVNLDQGPEIEPARISLPAPGQLRQATATPTARGEVDPAGAYNHSMDQAAADILARLTLLQGSPGLDLSDAARLQLRAVVEPFRSASPDPWQSARFSRAVNDKLDSLLDPSQRRFLNGVAKGDIVRSTARHLFETSTRRGHMVDAVIEALSSPAMDPGAP